MSKQAEAAPATGRRHTSKEIHEASGKLALLGEPLRLGLLVLIGEQERNVTELVAVACERMDRPLNQPGISHHLSYLRLAGLVEARRDSKHNIYALTPEGRSALEFAATFMES